MTIFTVLFKSLILILVLFNFLILSLVRFNSSVFKLYIFLFLGYEKLKLYTWNLSLLTLSLLILSLIFNLGLLFSSSNKKFL